MAYIGLLSEQARKYTSKGIKSLYGAYMRLQGNARIDTL